MDALRTLFTAHCLLLLCGPVPAEDEGRDLTANELKKLGSVVLTRENNLKTFVVTCDAPMPLPNMDIRMRSMLVWKAPDRTLVFADDPADGTPLLFSTLDDGGIYDPLQMNVRFHQGDAVPNFTVKLADGDFRHHFGFGSSVNADGTPALNREATIDVSFKQVFSDVRDEKVRKLDDGRYVLEALSGSGRTAIKALIDPKAALPLVRMELFSGTTGQELAAFTFLGNIALDDALFDVRLDELRQEGVSLKKGDIGAPLDLFQAFLHSFVTRSGISRPALRLELEKQLGLDPAWKELVASDAKISPKLRSHLQDTCTLAEKARAAGKKALQP